MHRPSNYRLLIISTLVMLVVFVFPAWHSFASGAVPFPTVPCDRFVPAPVEGLQVWDPERDPAGRRATDGVACARIIQDGQPVAGVPVSLTRPNGAVSGHSTGTDGVVSFIFYMQGGVENVMITGQYRGAPLTSWLAVGRTGSALALPPAATPIPLTGSALPVGAWTR